MGKNVLRGLAIIIPMVLLSISFWVAWMCIPADQRYLEKYNWLQDTMVIVPISVVVLAVVGGGVWMLYNYIRDNKANG